MNDKNNKYLLVFIVAIAVVVSGSFSNNYFAYYFWSKDKPQNSSNKSSIEKKPSTERKHEIKNEWVWNYSEIAAKEDNYPMVALRDGYKAIKLTDNKVLVGWKYEILNTSPETIYKATINYKFNDRDGFHIIESSASENIWSEESGTIQNTIWIPYEDYERISGASWEVVLTPNWNDKKLKGNSFERAGKILKEKAPYWLTTRLQYLFLSDFPVGDDGKGFMQFVLPNEWIIAQALGINPDMNLKSAGKNLNIDFSSYNIPPWETIRSNPKYMTLKEEEKESLKTYLRAIKEFGGYSPLKGRTSNFVYEDDFPEPGETKQN
jgi:hypothetical protein